jgi:hypothetical protein
MEFIGELERAFAALLYPWRFAIAGLAIAAMVGMLYLARRRRWDVAVRRHPRLSAGLTVLALAVALPTGWYLASPLFIRTQLDEPGPVAAATTPAMSPGPSPVGFPTPTPAMSSMPDPTGGPTSSLTPVATPFAPRTLASGTFKGADSFHFGRGAVQLIESAPGAFIVRFEGFSVRNGPDLYVYLSPNADGYARSSIELGRLKATDGSFNYAVPPETDLAQVRSVVIWCKQFSVLFASAGLG